MQYRREIDGIRAVAVLPVILFHAGFELFSGGFVGVDIFFVISGYLITSILFDEIERGDFSIARFYERRARRILPALFVVILACLPFAYIWMLPSQLTDFSQSVVAVVFFASNILFCWKDGYFAASAELQPLLHTWSLAVEEQYYLLFPLSMLLLRRLGRRRFFWSVVAIALMSLLLSELGWRSYPSINFYASFTRAWELLTGSICALVGAGQRQRRNDFLSTLGLLMIIFSIFYYDSATPFPSVYALVPVVGTALIIMFAAQGTWVARLLSTRTFVGIGLISYSAYLWHQPLFAFARLRDSKEPSEYLMAALAAATLLLAWATWRYVEQPFRRRVKPVLETRSRVFVASGGVGLALAAVGLAGHFGKGFEWRFDEAPIVALGQFVLPRLENGYCFYSVHDAAKLDIGSDGVKCYLATGDGAKILLFGDSFAAHWEPFWKKIAVAEDFSVNSVTTNWCFPSFGEGFIGPETSRAVSQCAFNRKWLRSNIRNYDILVFAGSWDAVQQRGYAKEVFEAIDLILKESYSKIIIMPGPMPLNRASVERVVYGVGGVDGLLIDNERNDKMLAFQEQANLRYGANERVLILKEDDLFGDFSKSSGLLTDEGLPYSLDGFHISVYGSLAAYRNFTRNGGIRKVDKLLGG